MRSQSQVWFFFSLAHDELTEDNLKKKKKKRYRSRRTTCSLKKCLNTPSDVFLNILKHFHSLLKSSWNYYSRSFCCIVFLVPLVLVPLRFARFLNTPMISQRANLFMGKSTFFSGWSIRTIKSKRSKKKKKFVYLYIFSFTLNANISSAINWYRIS